MSWSVEHLPKLQPLTRMDQYLRQVATDEDAIRMAVRMASRALIAAEAEGNSLATVPILGYLAEAHRILGELSVAEGYAREALEISEAADDLLRMIQAQVRLGEILRCQDRYDEAITALRGAMAAIQDEAGEAFRDFALQHLGKTYVNAGRFDEALIALREALILRQHKRDEGLLESTRQAMRYAVAGMGVRRRGMR